MRTLSQTLVVAVAAVLAMTGAAQAHHLQGTMVCDANRNGVIDGADVLLNGVVVRAIAQTAIPGATYSDISGDNSPPSFPGPGNWRIDLPGITDDYVVDLPISGRPPGLTLVSPPGGTYAVSIIHGDPVLDHRDGLDFLFVGCTPPSTTSTSTSTTTSSTSSTSSTTSTSTSSTSSTSSSTSTTSTTSTSSTATTNPLEFCQTILDHFKCYATAPDREFMRTDVDLTDQFGNTDATLLRPFRFCNPADKNDEGIVDPTAHLMCYQARDATRVGRRHVLVTNQFGAESLVVTRGESVCVPATKNEIPSALALDRFKCYRVSHELHSPPFTPREVTLADQFETKSTSVIRPLLLCNPVDLNGQGITNNQCHLLCYRVRDAAGQPAFVPQEITVEDDIMEGTLGTRQNSCRKVSLLCVPSIKAEVD